MQQKSYHTFLLHKETLILSSLKVMYLPDYEMVVVADVHLGKIQHFRKAGIAIPHEAALADIVKLEQIIQLFTPSKVLFLGDLFHSSYNDFVIVFKEFRLKNKLIEFMLVEGNHDIMKDSVYDQIGIEVCEYFETKSLIFTHEPYEVKTSKYNICGHIHPSVNIEGKGKQRVKLPCFYFGKELGILPAFGYFTGMASLKIEAGDKVFGVVNDWVLEIQ